ncbi:spermidine synthase [uncultured Phenylobacterium sp.]|uniref:spermine/spermidine synthase domain-containing protein n=1 Tax=uncultured Phenylobacterium sp. TaxID=349273 RepID=UPI0025F4870E|nr:spermidine synthase [uncultured Phenylobacterium sp.]
MNPWIHLDTAQIPGGGELKLMQRGGDYSIMSGAFELMNSRLYGSEVALADLAWAKMAERERPRILIGGLGMGFTLRAALAALPKAAKIVVAELVPEVIDWARGPLASLYGDSLDDPRVRLLQTDVAPLIRDANPPYDAILMDVDNGPDALGRDANDDLYSMAGLAMTRRAIKHGGVLAVWSAGPDQPFAGRMRRAGFAVEEHRVGASPSGKGPRHIIWVGMAR